MGCAECKLCHQEEEKNQFEYPNKVLNKQEIKEINSSNTETNSLQNILEPNTYSPKNKNFYIEFEKKLSSLGKFISEEDFQMAILDNINPNLNIYQKNDPFPFHRKNYLSHKMRPVEFNEGNIYYGEWNEQYEMDGYGKYYLKSEKVLCEGIWEKGELKSARIYYPNGEFYEGTMENSCYNGKGKLVNEKKDEYVGEFFEGEKNGQGKIKFFDGTKYEGNFSKNNFNGYGEMEWKNGIEYKGYFCDNYIEGIGEMEGEQEKYEGNFEKNLFHGKGKYIFYNGDMYDGDFEFGIRKGKGIYIKQNGIKFEGLWDNNVPNGFGKIYLLNGKIIKCNYHNGKIIGKPLNESDLYNNYFDYNFYVTTMKLSKKLSHLENPEDLISSQYRAGTILSFLDE